LGPYSTRSITSESHYPEKADKYDRHWLTIFNEWAAASFIDSFFSVDAAGIGSTTRLGARDDMCMIVSVVD
jgi:hypothetical protein